MNAARVFHTGTVVVLPGNIVKVLFTGGGTGCCGSPQSSTDLYDEIANTFAPAPATATMNSLRIYHTASPITSGPNAGKVLIAGGTVDSSTSLASTELYDPATNTFAVGPDMTIARQDHTASVIPSGPNVGKILIAGGGQGSSDSPLPSTEIYDPATNTIIPGPTMNAARVTFSATIITTGPNSGKILMAGGGGGKNPNLPVSSTELYNPTTNKFDVGPNMNAARGTHTAVVIPSGPNAGKILIAGGANHSGPLASAEIYDPNSDSFAAVADTPTMNDARDFPVAIPVSNPLLAQEFPIFTGRSTEPSIAVDPNNPTHAVVGFNDESISGNLKCGWAEFRDSGSWKSGSVQLPAGFDASGDPWVRYGSNGELFYSCIGKTPYTNPFGLFHTRNIGIFVDTSSSGLASDFGIANAVTVSNEHCIGVLGIDCNDNGEFTDHPAVALLRKPDRTDRLVACWIDFFIRGQQDRQTFVKVASSDDGRIWSRPKVLAAQGESCVAGGNNSLVGVSWRGTDGSLMISTSTDGVTWNHPFFLAATAPLVQGISTMSAVLSEPYAFLVPGQLGLRAVWQAGGPQSQIFIGDASLGSGDIHIFQDPVNENVVPFASKFLPGAGACDRLAGGYETTTLSGEFRYKVWRIDGAGPVAPIFTSGADLDPKNGDVDTNFPGFSRIGDYTGVDCSGSLGWVAWTDLQDGKPEIWGGRIPIP